MSRLLDELEMMSGVDVDVDWSETKWKPANLEGSVDDATAWEMSFWYRPGWAVDPIENNDEGPLSTLTAAIAAAKRNYGDVIVGDITVVVCGWAVCFGERAA